MSGGEDVVSGWRTEKLPSERHDFIACRCCFSQWEKSNFRFQPPVISEKKKVIRRLIYAWEKFSAIAIKK